jgi:flagellar motility protein MotE (MotC chaperone)
MGACASSYERAEQQVSVERKTLESKLKESMAECRKLKATIKKLEKKKLKKKVRRRKHYFY